MLCKDCGCVLSKNGFISLRFLTKENGLYYVVCPECGGKTYCEKMQNLSNGRTKEAAEG